MIIALVVAIFLALLLGLFLGYRFGSQSGLETGALANDFNKVTDSLTEGLHHVFGQVDAIRREFAEADGRISAELKHTTLATSALAQTAQSLEGALASPKSRGQWGERMADDVLRAADFVEGINYEREQTLAGGSRPDFTLKLPQNRVVHMDVKFPVDNYLRFLQASEADQPRFSKAFRNDVRQRIKELQDRDYIDPATTVDYILLFIPNESVYGFIHEQDPTLIDFALSRKIIPVSPTSLFMVLAVMRTAINNFRISQAGDEILASLGGLRKEWTKVQDGVTKMDRALNTARVALDDLAGTRSRGMERQLAKMEELGGEETVDLTETLRRVV